MPPTSGGRHTDAVLERQRRRRRTAEVIVALVPGTVLTGTGLASFVWAIQRRHEDMQRNYAMAAGTVLLVLGVVILTTTVIVMAVYVWREGLRHPSDCDWWGDEANAVRPMHR